jgi:hypothetical protein
MPVDKGKGKALPSGQTTLDMFVKTPSRESSAVAGGIASPSKKSVNVFAVAPRVNTHSSPPQRKRPFDAQLAAALASEATTMAMHMDSEGAVTSAPMSTEGEGGAAEDMAGHAAASEATDMDVDVDEEGQVSQALSGIGVGGERQSFEPHGDGGAPEPAEPDDDDDTTASLDAAFAAAAEQEEEAAAAASAAVDETEEEEAAAADTADTAEEADDVHSPPPPSVHTMLVDAELLSRGIVPESDPPPPAGPERDAWDDGHLKLPCSPVAGVEMRGGDVVLRWSVVVEALSGPLPDHDALSDAILRQVSRTRTRAHTHTHLPLLFADKVPGPPPTPRTRWRVIGSISSTQPTHFPP